MNAPLTLSTARSAADWQTLAQAYELLARRVAFVWGVAIAGDVLDAARNACTPLALVPYAKDAYARGCFADALRVRREQRAPGFEKLNAAQIDFLAGVAFQLWLSHRAEVGRRETQMPPADEHVEWASVDDEPAPWSPMTDYRACTEDASCRCRTCESEAEARGMGAYYRQHGPEVPFGFESEYAERDYCDEGDR